MLNSVQKEFNRRSESYKNYNFLQKRIVKELLSKISTKPQKILDLGAGDGEVFKNITWNYEKFYACEFAPNMRKLHPKAENLEVTDLDFNQTDFLKGFHKQNLIISSSSLQWAEDLEKSLKEIKTKTDNIAFSIFTDGTFRTIRDVAKIGTMLRDARDVEKLIQNYFPCRCEVKKYTLEFKSKKELFGYIKRSGVSGGERKLSYKETKDLINNYPTLTLECEVLFCVSEGL